MMNSGQGSVVEVPEKKESLLKKAWVTAVNILGSYTLGLVLMGILLVLTFYGTIFQTQPHPGMTVTEAAESFFSASFVLIPLGGERAVLALPLPGMWIVSCILFVNLLIGGVIRARKNVRLVGVLIAHIGILVLLGSIAFGNRASTIIEEIDLVPGKIYTHPEMGFGLRLHQFIPEFYPGTGKPKSFESELSIIDNEGREQQQAFVRMNEPLRVNGWTFYQMSYYATPQYYVSVLRGSHNPLEQWPKWASYIISFGLLWHFGWMFAGYLKGASKSGTEKGEDAEYQPMTSRKKVLLGGISFLVLVVFALGLMSVKPRIERVKVDGYQPWSSDFIEKVSGVAVEDGGRLKPFSTYAGFAMLQTLGKRSLTIETSEGSHKLNPVEWALDCMMRPDYAGKFPVFLVNREEVVQRLGLPELPEKRKRYSYDQLKPHAHEIYMRANYLSGMKSISDIDRDIISLAGNLYQVEAWMMMPMVMLKAPGRMDNGIYPAWFSRGGGTWNAVPQKIDSVYFDDAARYAGKGKLKEAGNALTYIFTIHNQEHINGKEARALSLERFYYRLDPLYAGLVFFIAGFVCLVIGYLLPEGRLSRLMSGGLRLPWLLALAGGIVLLGGMVIRMLVTMRSPVGNTYETIAFIACAGVFITLVMEAVNKRGIALAAGLLIGAFGCQMAIMYEAGNAHDHMDPLVAVLRSNFLLSTHVITIVLGYAAGLLAGLFSHIYVLAKPFSLFNEKTQNTLTRMAYATLCFSLLFTLVGTVFGGIWGNEAWGRFWGWDPKENGALLIILWQLMVLHARLAGYIRSWGLHVSNIVGTLLIGFAWWGVNTLGVGLHSYGFSQATQALHIFYWAEAFIVLLSLAVYYRWVRKA